jgi:hypothetical protein
MEVLQPMLPTISTLLFYTDAGVVANVCWALRCDSSSIQLCFLLLFVNLILI